MSLNSYKFRSYDESKPQRELLKLPPRRTWATPDTLHFILEKHVNNLPLPECMEWTNDDVLHWIEAIGFPQYKMAFYENQIDGKKLITIDASSIIKMNIHHFTDIQKILKEIRKIYNIELLQFNRSISLPPLQPETHYKFYKIFTGPKYLYTTRTKLWKQLKILQEHKLKLNHFEELTNWLRHYPYVQEIRIGKF